MTDEEKKSQPGLEPHDVRTARKIMAKPVKNPDGAEDSIERILARAVIRYYEASHPAPRPRGMGGEPGLQRMT